MKRLLPPLVFTLLTAGCQTTMDPNFALQMESYRLTVTTQQNVEVARARAEEARYNAIAAIGERSDGAAKQMAILALALGRGGSGADQHVNIPVQLPHIPENQEQRALKWAAIFAGPAISLVQGYFGYKLGVEQSRNTADSTIASYTALGQGFNSNVGIANAGFGATQSIANAGFGTIQNVATTGFGAVQGIATTGFTTLTRPNFIVTNSGVIGSGTYTGPYSGPNSGNAGRINSPNDDHTNNSTACVPTPPAIVC